MKKISLLIGLMLIAFSFSTLAQESVTFTWTVGLAETKTFGYRNNIAESFTIDWGEGSPAETVTGWVNSDHKQYTTKSHDYGPPGTYTVTLTANSNNLSFTTLSFNSKGIESIDLSKAPFLENFDCYGNKLTDLDLSKNTALASLNCSIGNLTSLVIGQSPGLTSLICTTNKLTTLDLSGAIGLTTLYAASNRLTDLNLDATMVSDIKLNGNQPMLSHAYAVTQKVTNRSARQFGDQTIDTKRVGIGAIVDLSSEVAFNGTNTTFTVTKGGATAVSGTDYTLNDGKFVFLQEAIYKVEMTNSAVTQAMQYGAITITATYQVEPMLTEASLANIEVSVGELTPSFESNVLAYTVNVGYIVTNITITATANAHGTVVGDGTYALQTGTQEFPITVTAEDGNASAIYKVTVIRSENDDASLSMLDVSAGDLDPEFNSAVFEYTVNLLGINKVTITATPTDSNATVEGDGLHNLTAGENVLPVKVTAVNGDTAVYTITVNYTSVGIDDMQYVNDVRVYPNPTTGKFRITNSESGINSVDIFDVYGRLLQSKIVNLQSTIEVDISHFPSGIYFIKMDKQMVKVLKK